ncbi:hypothetical protein FML15_22900 [Klebsiella michiganensis]|uniref:hypothetical protein n=1 Tax=Klebsiella michiganensis TaxID=1134687 RepID=UPI001CCF7C66|nr:hypothetical protein [Klebsiella michiganensis]MBZ7580126.1 hypothetical protein [Klebsiella michiganensis]
MNISTVNELIQSLESAGELSIRERKYLGLAKAYQQLDAAIKTGNMLADQNAQLAAENAALKSYRDTLDEIKSGLVGGGHGHMAKADMQAQSAVLDVIFDAFDAIETPATDRIVAGIKADGVEEFAAHLRDNDNGASVCKMIALGADDFAKQLREGADK